MALSEDQRAMLQLLLEGGQGYDDIASLLGSDREQIRVRAREALTEIGGTDPDADVGLTDYLLGQADPIGRADAARHLQASPEANEFARRVSAQLRLLAPQAELPELPSPRGGRAAAPPKSSAQAPPASPPSATPAASPSGAPAPAPAPAAPGRGLGERLPSLDSVRDRLRGSGDGRSRMPLALAGGGLVVLIAVLLITGVIGGGDEGSGGGGDGAPVADDESLGRVELESVGNGNAGGQAVFAQAGDQPVLQVNLVDLEPTSGGQNYVVWITAEDGRIAFPLARDRVGEDGNLTGAAPIPPQLIQVLSQFRSIQVTLADNAETQAALRQASGRQGFPSVVGEPVLTGQIPAEITQGGAAAGAQQGGAQGAQPGAGGQGQAGQGAGAGQGAP